MYRDLGVRISARHRFRVPIVGRYHEYAVGSPLVATTLYGLSGSDCYSTTLPATYSLYSLGAEVPPSTFAEMSQTTN